MPKPPITDTNFSSQFAWNKLKKEVLNPWTPQTLSLVQKNPELSEYLMKKTYTSKENSEKPSPLKKVIITEILEKSFHFEKSRLNMEDFEKNTENEGFFAESLNFRRKSCHNEIFGNLTNKERLLDISQNTHETAMEIKKKKEKTNKITISITDTDKNQVNNVKRMKTVIQHSKINEKSLNTSFVSIRTPMNAAHAWKNSYNLSKNLLSPNMTSSTFQRNALRYSATDLVYIYIVYLNM